MVPWRQRGGINVPAADPLYNPPNLGYDRATPKIAAHEEQPLAIIEVQGRAKTFTLREKPVWEESACALPAHYP